MKIEVVKVMGEGGKAKESVITNGCESELSVRTCAGGERQHHRGSKRVLSLHHFPPFLGFLALLIRFFRAPLGGTPFLNVLTTAAGPFPLDLLMVPAEAGDCFKPC